MLSLLQSKQVKIVSKLTFEGYHCSHGVHSKGKLSSQNYTAPDSNANIQKPQMKMSKKNFIATASEQSDERHIISDG